MKYSDLNKLEQYYFNKIDSISIVELKINKYSLVRILKSLVNKYEVKQ